MSRISKIQKYAVLWLNSQDYTHQQIKEELDLTDSQIKNVLKTNKVSHEHGVSKQSSLPNSKKLMITESQAGTHKVSIMTKAASEVNDENRKKILTQRNKDFSHYIHKPNG